MVPHSKIISWCIALTAVLLIAYFASIAFCIRPAGDDLALATVLREKGFAGALAYNFRSFNFRHVPILIMYTLFSLASFEKAYTVCVPPFYLFCLGVFVASCASVFRTLALRVYEKKLPRAYSYGCALLFTGTLYFNTFQSIEVWAFLNVMLYTLVPVVFSGAGLALLLTERIKNKPLKNGLLLLCALIAGSGFENYSSGLLLFLFCLLAYRYKTSAAFFTSALNRQLLLCFVALLGSSLLVYLAPGTFNRPGIEQQFIPSTHTASLFPFGGFLLQKKFAFVLLFLAGWLALGAGIPVSETQRGLFKKMLYATFFLTLVFLIITTLVSYAVFHGAAPIRAWFPFNVAATVFMVLLALYTGAFFLQQKGRLLFFSFPVLTVVLGIYCCVHIPGMWRYACAYDQRMRIIKTFKEDAPVLYLERLPSPGVVVASDLSADTGSYINKITRSAYGLPFSVAISK